MKLYRAKIPTIAREVIEELTRDGDIEVTPANRQEAEQDLISIMEEYLRRDMELREEVREHMAQAGIGYDQFGKTRARFAEEWNHPIGDDVERYLARQFIENFMISRFVDEVYTDDRTLWRKVLQIIVRHDVDERALREEAKNQIKNIPEDTVEYEMALQRALKEVRRRKGLI